ncbi:MAG: cytochrome c [Opitutus sp.]
MREVIARLVCVFAVGVIVALSHVFAVWHNPGDRQTPVPTVVSGSSDATPSGPVVVGRRIYDDHGCASCHAIAGEGNPRHPLDGVGSRLKATELREWITASGSTADDLAPSVVRRKQSYRELAPTEMEALIAYLGSLKSPH